MKSIINPYQVIGIMGLAKNTGKTTTLNYMIKLFQDEPIGLTSIGLDGEELDQINFMPKPRIMVRKGMVVATAEACLKDTKVSYEIIQKTELFTALGNIYIIRIMEEGFLVIAGPTTNSDLKKLIEWMKPYTEKLFIDGAFNRMTFSNIHLIDGMCLSTGATVHPQMKDTILKTKAIVDAYNFDKTSRYQSLPSHPLIIHTDDQVYLYKQKNYQTYQEAIEKHSKDMRSIYIQGAITPRIIDLLVSNHIKNIEFVCDHPSKLLITEKHFTFLKQLFIDIKVIQQTRMLFVTINPYHPTGASYDADLMLNEMKKQISIPIYNVMKMEEEHV